MTLEREAEAALVEAAHALEAPPAPARPLVAASIAVGVAFALVALRAPGGSVGGALLGLLGGSLGFLLPVGFCVEWLAGTARARHLALLRARLAEASYRACPACASPLEGSRVPASTRCPSCSVPLEITSLATVVAEGTEAEIGADLRAAVEARLASLHPARRGGSLGRRERAFVVVFALIWLLCMVQLAFSPFGSAA